MRVDSREGGADGNPINPPNSTPAPVRLWVEHVSSNPESAGMHLVICHGFGGSRRNFRPQARAIRDLAHTTLYDARGHGKSEAPICSEAYHFESLVTDLLHVVDTLPTPRVIVGGLSLGAATALAFARRYPFRVRGLLLASLPPSGALLNDWALSLADAIEREGAASAAGHLLSQFGAATGGDAARVMRGLLEHPAQALVSLLRHAVAEIPEISGLAEDGRALAMPTQIVAGQRDVSSMEQGLRLHQLMPTSRLQVIPSGGHLVNLTTPEAFNGTLREFLRRVLGEP